MEKTVEEVVDFLRKSEVSFTMPGCYMLPSRIVKDAINELLEKGESDLIKKHKEWTWSGWDIDNLREGRDDIRDLSSETINKWIKLREFWGDTEDARYLLECLEKVLEREAYEQTYEYRKKVGITKQQRNECLIRDNMQCCVCKNATVKLEIDHKIELMDGGSNELENLQSICHECHVAKTKLSRAQRKQTI